MGFLPAQQQDGQCSGHSGSPFPPHFHGNIFQLLWQSRGIREPPCDTPLPTWHQDRSIRCPFWGIFGAWLLLNTTGHRWERAAPSLASGSWVGSRSCCSILGWGGGLVEPGGALPIAWQQMEQLPLCRGAQSTLHPQPPARAEPGGLPMEGVNTVAPPTPEGRS